MNQWTKLLAQLDKVFGSEEQERSRVKKLGQLFDEKTGEHVFILENRMVKGALRPESTDRSIDPPTSV